MPDAEAVKTLIRTAFTDVPYPGDWCLRGSNDGDEPYLLEAEFKGKTDWRALDASFIDQAPHGFGSALSFFSDEAFRFYLPAYLIAEIDGLLERSNPLFHLTHGLTDAMRYEPVNSERYGARTWFEESSHRLSVFDHVQAAAIVAYLRLKRDADEFDRDDIDQALKNFWLRRAGSLPDGRG